MHSKNKKADYGGSILIHEGKKWIRFLTREKFDVSFLWIRKHTHTFFFYPWNRLPSLRIRVLNWEIQCCALWNGAEQCSGYINKVVQDYWSLLASPSPRRIMQLLPMSGHVSVHSPWGCYPADLGFWAVPALWPRGPAPPVIAAGFLNWCKNPLPPCDPCAGPRWKSPGTAKTQPGSP